jgi:arylsulfatase A-like enzyme
LVTNPYLKKDHGFAQGFHSFVERELNAGEVVDLFLEWLNGGSGTPYFAFLHFIDVHAPWTPEPPYDALFEVPEKAGDEETDRLIRRLLSEEQDKKFWREQLEKAVDQDSPAVEIFKGRYDGEIRFVDDSLDRLFSALEERGRLDSSLIIITADHGDEFLEHGRLGHGDLLYDGLIRVPLIFRLPGGTAGTTRVPAPVSLVDVMPTILGLSGVSLPPGLSGRNLATLFLDGQTIPHDPVPVFSELIKRDFRRESIQDPGNVTDRSGTTSVDVFLRDATPAQISIELYDLLSDPGEASDLAGEQAGLVDDLTAALDAHLDALHPRVDLQRVLHEIDPEMEERLRALGYLE